MHSYIVFDNWLCCVVFSDIHGTNYELNPCVNSNTKLNIISLLNSISEYWKSCTNFCRKPQSNGCKSNSILLFTRSQKYQLIIQMEFQKWAVSLVWPMPKMHIYAVWGASTSHPWWWSRIFLHSAGYSYLVNIELWLSHLVGP